MSIGNRTAPGFEAALAEIAQDHPPGLFGLSLAALHRYDDFLAISEYADHHPQCCFGILQAGLDI
jgi:hypothetical protein